MCFIVTAREIGEICEQTEMEESDVGLYQFRMDSLTSVSSFSSRSHSVTGDALRGGGGYGFCLGMRLPNVWGIEDHDHLTPCDVDLCRLQ